VGTPWIFHAQKTIYNNNDTFLSKLFVLALVIIDVDLKILKDSVQKQIGISEYLTNILYFLVI
jgi:hypothetical protein